MCMVWSVWRVRGDSRCVGRGGECVEGKGWGVCGG